MRQLAIVLPYIRDDYVGKCLDTMYKHTEKDSFYVIGVDQTVNGYYDKRFHLYLRPARNLGFAKAANEGIIHAVRWGIPYIGVLNDDTEFMGSKWFQGILDEFATDEKILAVCPESPRVPLWGYGRDHGEYIDIIEYKEEYTEEDWNYLCSGNYEDLKERVSDIPEAFPLIKRGVIDAIAMWFPVFKREFFDLVGYFDEKFYPGGGEDYSLNARAYSCAWPDERDECDDRFHYRLVSSMRSWVWHWWGKSKDEAASLPKELNIFDEKLRWNNLDELWPPELNQGRKMDPWGHYKDDNGIRRPFKRVKEVHIEPL